MHSFIKKINYVKYNDLFKTIQFLFEILFNIIKKKKIFKTINSILRKVYKGKYFRIKKIVEKMLKIWKSSSIFKIKKKDKK